MTGSLSEYAEEMQAVYEQIHQEMESRENTLVVQEMTRIANSIQHETDLSKEEVGEFVQSEMVSIFAEVKYGKETNRPRGRHPRVDFDWKVGEVLQGEQSGWFTSSILSLLTAGSSEPARYEVTRRFYSEYSGKPMYEIALVSHERGFNCPAERAHERFVRVDEGGDSGGAE